MLLCSSDIAELITSNLCLKEHIIYGISTMIYDYTTMLSKDLKLEKEKIPRSNN